ncbi:MAG: ParB/RepB/Spo0J family partition protein [Lachnospiraceae bacterium]|nr:ParB/RepB/Spo0J family partition protein [Lachnospiraceae bacterium]
MAKRGLGKGLDSLIPSVGGAKGISAAKSENEIKIEGATTMVGIGKVQPNKGQPRKNFNEDALEELADSIKLHGIISPIVVQDRKDYYEIIAGERRWRAAMKAGLKEVPVIIKNYTEEEIVVISLLENIQREDLSEIEEAHAYKKLIDEFGLKQDEVAEKVSKSRTTITNSIRLLKLSEDVQQMINDDMITAGHARALISIEDPEEQYRIAQQIFDEKLSVRDVEKLVKNLGKTKIKKDTKKIDKALEAIYKDIEEKLKQKLDTKVSVIPSSKSDGSGKLEIEFYSNDDLEKIIDILNKAK